MKTNDQRMKEIYERADVKRAKKRKYVKWISVTACCLSLVLALNLVLFVPYPSGLPDISAYSGSEYYPLMQQLNALTYRNTNTAHNNFEAWFVNLSRGDANSGSNDMEGDIPNSGTAEDPSTPGDPGNPESGSDYNEVTDNQEAGVIEGDRFKRTSTHFFYVQGDGYTDLSLSAFTIDRENSAYCGTLTMPADDGTSFSAYYGVELYLSDDGDTATIFAPVFTYKTNKLYTAVISADVSNPENMQETGRVYVSGSYVTSRKIGEGFLLISNFAVRSNPDFSDESAFLPQVGTWNKMESLPMQDIICPDTATAARYTVIVRLGEGLSVDGHIAFLSYSQEVYVSEDNIFVTRSHTQTMRERDYERRIPYTQIACVAYSGGGLTLKGSADVAGTVLNQYSLDEQDNTLRVVTTVSESNVRIYENGGVSSDDVTTSFGTNDNASLYVLSLDDFSVIASLERFAPEGEEVTSVRFEEDIVWVCTARIWELTDPVFRIDLSNLDNITYTDTGTIEGYSTSLVDFTDGTLLGIGRGSDTLLKIEIYEQGEDGVVSVATYETNADYSQDYKAYFIDRENGLIGLHVYDFIEGSKYLLLHFDGYTLTPVAEIDLTSRNYDTTRAAIVDGWLYILTDLSRENNQNDYHAEPVPGLAE